MPNKILENYQGTRYKFRYSRSQDHFSIYNSLITDNKSSSSPPGTSTKREPKTKHNITIYTICDGHGSDGHTVAEYVSSDKTFSLPIVIAETMHDVFLKSNDATEPFLTEELAVNACEYYAGVLYSPVGPYMKGIGGVRRKTPNITVDRSIFIDSGTTVVMVIAVNGSFKYIFTIGDALAIWRHEGDFHRTDPIDPRSDIDRLKKYLSSDDIDFIDIYNRVRYLNKLNYISLAVSRAIGDFRWNKNMKSNVKNEYVISPIPKFVSLTGLEPDNGYIVISSDSIEEAATQYANKFFVDQGTRKVQFYQYVYYASISGITTTLDTILPSLSTDDTTLVLLRESTVKLYYPNILVADTFSELVKKIESGSKAKINGVMITNSSIGGVKTNWKTVQALIIAVSFINGGISPLNYSPFILIE